jgi:hypothetical protein
MKFCLKSDVWDETGYLVEGLIKNKKGEIKKFHPFYFLSTANCQMPTVI